MQPMRLSPISLVLMAFSFFPLLAFAASEPPAQAPLKSVCELQIFQHRQRELSTWKPQIAAYSQRHYAENTWQLEPKVIVLHYTAGSSFPWNLVQTQDFAGETPGLAVHYVVDKEQIWQLLPTDVRSRGAFGINHRAINIEMVALHAQDLARRSQTLATTARLTACLMQTHQIPLSKVYSHQDVSRMDPRLTPEVLDLLHPGPYHKIDPGLENMRTIQQYLRSAGVSE